jgi:hypothetical protein
MQMDFYNDLLNKAVKSIEERFKKRLAGNLLTDRAAVLPAQAQQVTDKTDFELITWLIIR